MRERIKGTTERRAAMSGDEEKWENVNDEWTGAINAAHPTRRKDAHEQYSIAMRMVGHRHSKHALVSLVSWLLVQIKDGNGSNFPSPDLLAHYRPDPKK